MGWRPGARWSWAAALAVTVLGLANAAVWGGSLLFLRPARPATANPAPPPVPTFEPSPQAAVSAGDALPVFARSDGVALRLVSAEAFAVAFHEASYRDATGLRPMGRCSLCRNRLKFSPPEPRDAGLEYIVTDTRGRETPATAAADLVLPRGADVFAPVTGTVTGLRRYRLYSRHPDVRVEITPDQAPHRRVVMLHLAAVGVHRGQQVEASVTRIGSVRGFPFESQVDRYIRGRYPHVHLEVKNPAKTAALEERPKPKSA
jgi:hypothetical protein